MVSIAGILANLLIAVIGFAIFKFLLEYGVFTAENARDGFGKILVTLFMYLVIMNVSLAVFNLLPFPPLDGSKVLATFLPESFQPVFELLEQFGFLILMALIYFGLVRLIMTPVLYLVEYLLFTPWF
jgi:Zn-dependent protease